MEAINPYQPPIAVAISCNESNTSALFVHITGFLCALVACVGALSRCLIELFQLDFSGQSLLSNDPSAFIAICTLAFATGLSLCLYGFVQKYVSRDNSTYCQCLLLIAMLAMCTRAMLDPSTCWTPTWQTYVLTASGVISLAIILRHVRNAIAIQATS